MTFIKQVYIEGFKSFAKPTEIIFDKGLNVIVGPNGSGKSNIVDAILFCLGRLSTKSLRADKSSSLIFKGTKEIKQSDKARIKIFLDNSSGVFSVDNEKPREIIIERILNKNGGSIYRINGKTKTRNELLELLLQAGINPHGFNLILQSEIYRFVDMRAEERRKLIEDLAGISIYEFRKNKAVNELKATEQKIKEIKAILNEKLNFLRNLEKEKKQAQRYTQLRKEELEIKYSIIKKKEQEKVLQKNSIKEKTISILQRKEELENNIGNLVNLIENYRKQIESIDAHIEEISGVEQSQIQNEIMLLKTQIAKLEVKKETQINFIKNAEEKIKNLGGEAKAIEENLKKLREEIKTDGGAKGKISIDELNKRINSLKEKISRLENKKEEIKELENELNLVNEKINFLNKEYLYISSQLSKKKEEIRKLRAGLVDLGDVNNTDLKNEKIEIQKKIEQDKLYIEERSNIIARYNFEKEKIMSELKELRNLKICPKCKRALDEKHINKLKKNAKISIDDINAKIAGFTNEIEIIKNEISNLERKQKLIDEKIRKLEKNLELKKEIEKRKEELALIVNRKNEIEEKINSLNKRKEEIEKRDLNMVSIDEEISNLNEKLNDLIIEKEKIKNRLNLSEKRDTEIRIKERELERIHSVIKITRKEQERVKKLLHNYEEELNEIKKLLKEKEQRYNEIQEQFSELIEKKNKFHKYIAEYETEVSKYQKELSNLLNELNELKIEEAKVDAEISVVRDSLKEIKAEVKQENLLEIKEIHLPLFVLEEKLEKLKMELEKIGNVNLLALETYEKVKNEVSEVEERLKKVDNEKNEIEKHINKIEGEKKRVFLNTFEKINKEFSNNFFNLSDKGYAKLVIEDRKNIFNSGVDIIIQFGKGKYFSSSSMSGGEKVLIALSFIFAIQKLTPYPFYVFDEIDAALDKRNSERLAELLKKHIGKQQCIIISHNDAVINKADLMYGVTMQNGVSKIFSLKL